MGPALGLSLMFALGVSMVLAAPWLGRWQARFVSDGSKGAGFDPEEGARFGQFYGWQALWGARIGGSLVIVMSLVFAAQAMMR
jgi:hypothetical protein